MTRVGTLRELFHEYDERFTRRLAALARAYGAPATRYAFAFVFLTFGVQKFLVPGPSPVDEPIMAIADASQITTIVPATMTPAFVGIYEVLLGLCFLRNRLGVATLLFVPHHLVTFLTLAVVPSLAFAPPIPFAYDTFGAFVLKNVVFVGAFLLLLAHHGHARPTEASRQGTQPASDRHP